MLLGNTIVTSVHVLFCESIPERPTDYFESWMRRHRTVMRRIDGQGILIALWVHTLSIRSQSWTQKLLDYGERYDLSAARAQ